MSGCSTNRKENGPWRRSIKSEANSGILGMLIFSQQRGQIPMWSGFDPELRRQLATIRQLVGLRHQTPTREWPLIYVAPYKASLVVREWPDGSITSYIVAGRPERRPRNGTSKRPGIG